MFRRYRSESGMSCFKPRFVLQKIWRMKFKFHTRQNLEDFEKQFIWLNVNSQQDKKETQEQG